MSYAKRKELCEIGMVDWCVVRRTLDTPLIYTELMPKRRILCLKSRT